mmetsp:Transcript_32403/g.104621  ORF Transcript_32403/g.104621 Transcript_32403/m.104621 type:complete len:276 (+) Transcript_32403:635-1462(+)
MDFSILGCCICKCPSAAWAARPPRTLSTTPPSSPRLDWVSAGCSTTCTRGTFTASTSPSSTCSSSPAPNRSWKRCTRASPPTSTLCAPTPTCSAVSARRPNPSSLCWVTAAPSAGRTWMRPRCSRAATTSTTAACAHGSSAAARARSADSRSPTTPNSTAPPHPHSPPLPGPPLGIATRIRARPSAPPRAWPLLMRCTARTGGPKPRLSTPCSMDSTTRDPAPPNAASRPPRPQPPPIAFPRPTMAASIAPWTPARRTTRAWHTQPYPSTWRLFP